MTVPSAAEPGLAVTVPPAAQPAQPVAAPPAAGPAQTTPVPAAARLSFQGHFAGAVSRFLAYVTDVAVGTAVYTLAVAGLGFVVSVITSKSVSWNRANIVVEILYFAWMFLYFAYSWAASGKTLGMAALGVKVVSADGADASARQAVIRTLAFPLSFLLLGLGFLGIVVQRDRRALHDLIAGTAVVYAWDARSARLRFLARDKPPAAR
jgi:uncharacterized RDD family membrane protein YckC